MAPPTSRAVATGTAATLAETEISVLEEKEISFQMGDPALEEQEEMPMPISREREKSTFGVEDQERWTSGLEHQETSFDSEEQEMSMFGVERAVPAAWGLEEAGVPPRCG